MIEQCLVGRLLVAAVVAGVAWGGHGVASAQERGEKTEDQKAPEKRSGTVVGTLVAKGENFIEVKADGEEKARRYVPHWVGGAPAQGGGPDKKMLQVIRGLKVGSRLRLEWEFEERPRVVRVEVLKAAEGGEGKQKGKDKEAGEKRKGKVIGTLTDKGKGWIEVKADGEERARRYALHFGGTKELLRAMEETPVGSRVQVEWLFFERWRVLSLEPVGKASK
jgi:hypothetical protein